MPYLLHAREVVEMALNIEQNGKAFYSKAAELSDDEKIVKLFSFLAEQEQRHYDQFQAILASGGDFQPTEELGEEEADYLRALADTSIFTPDFQPEDAATQTRSPQGVLRIGINVEKDSILLYRSMEDYVAPAQAETVREIRRQEEMHLRILNQMLNSLMQS